MSTQHVRRDTCSGEHTGLGGFRSAGVKEKRARWRQWWQGRQRCGAMVMQGLMAPVRAFPLGSGNMGGCGAGARVLNAMQEMEQVSAGEICLEEAVPLDCAGREGSFEDVTSELNHCMDHLSTFCRLDAFICPAGQCRI